MTPAIVAAERAKVAFELLQYAHDPRAASYGLEAAELLGLDAATVFKTLVVETDAKKLAVAVVPVSAQLDLKAMADSLGTRRVSMADAGAAERSSGYVVGGISPLGQRRPLPTVIDESAQSLARVHVSAGKRGLEIALAPRDLARLCGATFEKIARAET